MAVLLLEYSHQLLLKRRLGAPATTGHEAVE
jgi:hypothetical protein